MAVPPGTKQDGGLASQGPSGFAAGPAVQPPSHRPHGWERRGDQAASRRRIAVHARPHPETVALEPRRRRRARRGRNRSVAAVAVPSEGAAIGNTYLTTGAGAATNMKEDLADYIWRIDPESTPLATALGRGENADQIVTQWLVQELNAADSNVQPEGWRYVAQPAKKPNRTNNVCQIMVRTITVSNTLRATDTVGGDEFTRQKMLKGVELRRDLEWWITRGLVRTTTDPRQMSGIQCFISNGTMGATGAMPTGDGSNGPTPGTPRALSLDLIASAMQAAFAAGGKPTLGLLGPAQKRIFSGLSGTAGTAATNMITHTAPQAMTIVGAVDAYMTDFGTIQMAPDLFMPTNVVLLIDPEYAEIAPLQGRDMDDQDYAITGDAADGGMVFEGTLRVTAPKAHAMVGDLS